MKYHEQGFTLVELIITITITAVLFSMIGTAIYQMSTISSSGNTQLTIWHELQNVTYRLEKDCQSALTAGGGSSLTLTYPNGETITYALAGTTLQHTSGADVTVLAKNISNLDFSVADRLVTMNITASVSGRAGSSEQITSMVSLRPTAP